MKKPPCYKCEERRDLCHKSCEKYLAWQSEHEKEKQYLKAFIRRNEPLPNKVKKK